MVIESVKILPGHEKKTWQLSEKPLVSNRSLVITFFIPMKFGKLEQYLVDHLYKNWVAFTIFLLPNASCDVCFFLGTISVPLCQPLIIRLLFRFYHNHLNTFKLKQQLNKYWSTNDENCVQFFCSNITRLFWYLHGSYINIIAFIGLITDIFS